MVLSVFIFHLPGSNPHILMIPVLFFAKVGTLWGNLGARLRGDRPREAAGLPFGVRGPEAHAQKHSPERMLYTLKYSSNVPTSAKIQVWPGRFVDGGNPPRVFRPPSF